MNCALAAALTCGLIPTAALAAGDFTKRTVFEAQYAYLDATPSKIAQRFYSVTGVRRGGIWKIDVTGADRTGLGSHSDCKDKMTGRTVAPGRVVAGTPNGTSGQFEIRREGEYVRLTMLSPPGICILKEGLYLVPEAVD